MRISLLVFLAIFATTALAAALEAVPSFLRSNEITRVNPGTREITIGVDPAEMKTYRCTAQTEIRVDDQPATFSDLAPGMMVIVTATAPGVAARLAAVKPTVAPPPRTTTPMFQRTVTVPATATPRDPVKIGGLRSGEIVSIVARAVRWSSGGSKAGVFCDWNGYRDDRVHGVPRMSLVAMVGRSIFVPAGDTFNFTVVDDGGFMLFVNDDTADDNKGAAEITINIGWK